MQLSQQSLATTTLPARLFKSTLIMLVADVDLPDDPAARQVNHQLQITYLSARALVIDKYILLELEKWVAAVQLTPIAQTYVTALRTAADTLRQRRLFHARKYTLDTQVKTSVYGILNITDDSFYDGGRYFTPAAAIKRAQEMVAQGADVLELGGQSTRKGYVELTAAEEIARVVPVLEAIRPTVAVPIAVDTYKYEVVRAVLAAGADIINDVRPLQADPRILEAIAAVDAGLVIMHTQNGDQYTDLAQDIHDYFATAIDFAGQYGIERQQLILDVGLGTVYGKNYEQEYSLLRELDYFNDLGVATLIAPSRKGFIGTLLDLPVEERLVPTMAIFANSAGLDVNFMRAHDIAETRYTLGIIDKIKRSFSR
ncbi:dihydropteroate synthase [Loigolactobacillus zhaoyuanensis]|uniref:Dihydropteroate synthase n=1 Tax=Loigolactobacillus zhaoyuanensis TaxID=2486017 RepID=A0ABW8UDJ1_9LACO|nr:dihydropteroate synthase [Loigolactobacillus zhaoyuanensis]